MATHVAASSFICGGSGRGTEQGAGTTVESLLSISPLGYLTDPVYSPRRAASSASTLRVRSARAHPNTRLKLSVPGVYGRIPFVNVHFRRRSLGAFRYAAHDVRQNLGLVH